MQARSLGICYVAVRRCSARRSGHPFAPRRARPAGTSNACAACHDYGTHGTTFLLFHLFPFNDTPSAAQLRRPCACAVHIHSFLTNLDAPIPPSCFLYFSSSPSRLVSYLMYRIAPPPVPARRLIALSHCTVRRVYRQGLFCLQALALQIIYHPSLIRHAPTKFHE